MASGRFAVGPDDSLSLGTIFDLMILTSALKAALEDEPLLRPTGCISATGIRSATAVAFSSTLATALAIELLDGVDEVHHRWNPTIGR